MKKLFVLIFMATASFGLAIANPETKQKTKEDTPYHQTVERDAIRITKGLAALAGVATCVFIDATVTDWLCAQKSGNRFYDKYYNYVSNFIKRRGVTEKHILDIDDSKMVTAIPLAITATALGSLLAHYGLNKKLFPCKKKERKDKA